MKRLTVVALAVVLGFTACRDETTTPSGDSSPELSQGSSRSISGWFHTQWGDPRGGRGPALVRHELIDDRGRATELLLDDWLVARPGGEVERNALPGHRQRRDAANPLRRARD